MKYIIHSKSENSEYWEYCMKNEIPQIRIIHGKIYSKIEYTLTPMLQHHTLNSALLEEFSSIYEGYCKFFQLPASKMLTAGGSTNLIFTVFRVHAELIASQLYEYLIFTVTKYRKSNLPL